MKTRKQNGETCYCEVGRAAGSETRVGHVHGKPMSAVDWAKGIQALAGLAGDSRVVWLAGLPKAKREADRILRGAR